MTNLEQTPGINLEDVEINHRYPTRWEGTATTSTIGRLNLLRSLARSVGGYGISPGDRH